MERLALLLPQPEAGADRPDFFTVVLTDVARDAAYALTQALRDAGFRGEMGFFLPQHQERHASGRKVRRAFLPPHW